MCLCACVHLYERERGCVYGCVCERERERERENLSVEGLWVAAIIINHDGMSDNQKRIDQIFRRSISMFNDEVKMSYFLVSARYTTYNPYNPHTLTLTFSFS